MLSEANRVLRTEGLFFVSSPNMGWWVNRVSLLLGYQPPDVEVSKIYTVNLPPFYPRKKSIGYIHSVTLKGMIELLSNCNFDCLKVFSTRIPKSDLNLKKPPIPSTIKYLIRILDSLLSCSPNLSVKSLIVGKKSNGR